MDHCSYLRAPEIPLMLPSVYTYSFDLGIRGLKGFIERFHLAVGYQCVPRAMKEKKRRILFPCYDPAYRAEFAQLLPIFRSNMIMALFAHDQFSDLVNSQLTGIDDLFHG